MYKRGEYIKNYRPRYFRLTSSGELLGYKNKPEGSDNAREPVENKFSIKDCTVTKGKDSEKFAKFNLKCLQYETFVERKFSCATVEERDNWVQVLQDHTKHLLDAAKPASAIGDLLEESLGPTENTKKSLDDFEIMKVLGKGTFGKVYMAKEKASGEVFAIKVLRKDVVIQKEEIAHTMTEGRVLRMSQHPFLTSLHYSFQTDDRLCFVMDYVKGGELFFHIARERKFTEPRARFYGCEITLALEYLHKQNVVYRDLKLENLLLDHEGHIKITDFGLCKEQIKYGDTCKTFCGTPEYLAPEILDDRDYGRAVDWWGLGVVLYEMLCGKLPFYNKNHETLFEMIVMSEVKYPNNISPDAKSILAGLLTKEPTKRLGGGARGAAELKEHAFHASVNWDDAYNKLIPPPFVPTVESLEDTSNFDTMFTNETPNFTPVNTGVLEDNNYTFNEFTYVAKPEM